MTTSSNESSDSTPEPTIPPAASSSDAATSSKSAQSAGGGQSESPSGTPSPARLKDGISVYKTVVSSAAAGTESLQNTSEESDLEMVRRGSQSLPPQYDGVDLQRRLHRIQTAQYMEYKRAQFRRSAILFLLTFLSTFLVGANYMPLEYVVMKMSPGYAKYLTDTLGSENLSKMLEEAFQQGYHYSVPLMLILFCHEMGHYLQSVKYRVPASLPYFIPLPLPPMGTMGAVIFQGRGTATRKQMFDIAVSGPLAGLLITIPVLWYGIKTSAYMPKPPVSGLEFGEPMLVKWMMNALHGPEQAGKVFMLNSLGFAGWVGVLITAMNLLPVGQLDGGHILYTLIGKPAHYVAYGVIGLAIAFMVWQQNFSFSLLLLLLLMTGPKHPPTANDNEPIGLARHLVGWATLSFLIIGFTPNPIIVPEVSTQQPQPAELPTPEFASVKEQSQNDFQF